MTTIVKKRHIEFIVDDEWANTILDQADEIARRRADIDKQIWKSVPDSEERNRLLREYEMLFEQFTKVASQIEERYCIDKDLNYRQTLSIAWFEYSNCKGNKQRLFEAIKKEQERRRIRKRQSQKAKRKAVRMGLW